MSRILVLGWVCSLGINIERGVRCFAQLTVTFLGKYQMKHPALYLKRIGATGRYCSSFQSLSTSIPLSISTV